MTTLTRVLVESCGIGHAPLPRAHITADLTEWFRDPHVSDAMRAMTARDLEVVEHVRRTAGVSDYTTGLFELVARPVKLGVGLVHVVVFCAGGL